MAKRSAGILLYRRRAGAIELLLVHPGGPFWARKDVWSIPKGEYDRGEDPLAVAWRELAEETGTALRGDALPLGEVVQRGGKVVTGFAAEGDFDPAQLRSNHFELEWPPRSGRRTSFPEVDRAEWFEVAQARRKILPAQAAFIDRLLAALGPRS